MSRGEEIVKILLEHGNEWTTAELSKELGCTPNSVQLAMTKVRRLCTLIETLRPSSGTSVTHYRALVDRGVGLLSMNKPIHKHHPSRVHKHND